MVSPFHERDSEYDGLKSNDAILALPIGSDLSIPRRDRLSRGIVRSRLLDRLAGAERDVQNSLGR